VTRICDGAHGCTSAEQAETAVSPKQLPLEIEQLQLSPLVEALAQHVTPEPGEQDVVVALDMVSLHTHPSSEKPVQPKDLHVHDVAAAGHVESAQQTALVTVASEQAGPPPGRPSGAEHVHDVPTC
jgi:hypothetical protein